MDHRCADWFDHSRLRPTATTGKSFRLKTIDILDGFHISHMTMVGSIERLDARMGQICKAWFAQRRSNEAIMKGTWTEQVVFIHPAM